MHPLSASETIRRHAGQRISSDKLIVHRAARNCQASRRLGSTMTHVSTLQVRDTGSLSTTELTKSFGWDSHEAYEQQVRDTLGALTPHRCCERDANAQLRSIPP